MLKNKDFYPGKKAFVFELDDVLYPERDYLLQIYYLFSNFIEFTEGFPLASDLTEFFKNTYLDLGDNGIFDRAKGEYGIEEKYRDNFDRLYYSARLPLKLLLFPNVLILLQELINQRKEIFIVTNGKPEIQINKIMQTEWNGLEKYLKVYYSQEINLKPEPDVLSYILKKYDLLKEDLLIVGSTQTDEKFAVSGGVDFLNISEFM
jgi:FMN phosphatase YigB (HAD superfamily)